MGEGAWWASMALVAAVSALCGFLLGRSRRRSVAPASELPVVAPAPLLKELIARALPLELLPGPSNGQNGDPSANAGREPLARCLPKALGPDGLSCELLDSAALGETVPGRKVTCYFAPLIHGERKLNAFETVIASVDPMAEPPSMLLAAPTQLLSMPRRRYPRKRVSDPRFVRVRLWLAQAGASPVHFPDAVPDIWINAYDGHHGEENAVTNISAGGLAVEVRAGLVPKALELGSPVVLKCSLFQFREKQFKPYWYAGLVRGVNAPGGKLMRLAVGFTHVGRPDETQPQGIAWTQRPKDEI